MDRNTYTPAARKLLTKLRSVSVNQDMQIAKDRRIKNNEIAGAISLLSEGERAEPCDRNYFTYEPLGIRVCTKDVFCYSSFYRRSCQPNLDLVHYVGRNLLIAIFIRFNRPIGREELTLPFNHGWEYSDIPLVCVFHKDGVCPLETKRQGLARMREVFRSMGDNLKVFAGSVHQLFAEMSLSGCREGKIVVSGDGSEIQYAVGNEEAKRYDPAALESQSSTSHPAIEALESDEETLNQDSESTGDSQQ